MTLADQLLSLYSGDDLVRMQHAVLASGLPPDDFYFIGAIEARRATLAAEKAREEAQAASEKADRALELSKRHNQSIASELKEFKAIGNSLGGGRILAKALFSRAISFILAILLGLGGGIFAYNRLAHAQTARLASLISTTQQIQRELNTVSDQVAGAWRTLSQTQSDAVQKITSTEEKAIKAVKEANCYADTLRSIFEVLHLPNIAIFQDAEHGGVSLFVKDRDFRVIPVLNTQGAPSGSSILNFRTNARP